MNTIEELDIDYFITLIQEREIIWDKSNVDFKNKNLKTKAWEDISKVLFPDYENFTAERKNKVGEFTVQIFMFFFYLRGLSRFSCTANSAISTKLVSRHSKILKLRESRLA